MMKCKKVIERYDDVVEGSLSWKESRAIDQHLQACSVCASQFEELKSYPIYCVP